MRFLILVFVVLTFPIVVLLSTLFFGGFSATILKSELVDGHVYSSMADMLLETDSDAQTPEERKTTIEIVELFRNRLTPEYIQQKSERFIDDSSLWITGATTTPPTLSLSELKEDLVATHPELLDMAEQVNQNPQPVNEDINDDSSVNNSDQQPLEEQVDTLALFVKNDFNFSMESSLAPVKQTYQTMRISFFVLDILLIASIGAILLLSPNWSSRLRWIGATLFLSAVAGYILTIFTQVAFETAIKQLVTVDQYIFRIIFPVIQNITAHFIGVYRHYSTLVSIFIGIAGVILFSTSFLPKIASPKPTISPSRNSKIQKKK